MNFHIPFVTYPGASAVQDATGAWFVAARSHGDNPQYPYGQIVLRVAPDGTVTTVLAPGQGATGDGSLVVNEADGKLYLQTTAGSTNQEFRTLEVPGYVPFGIPQPLAIVAPFSPYTNNNAFGLPTVRKIAGGLVILQGVLSATGNTGTWQKVAMLPVGMRPAAQLIINVPASRFGDNCSVRIDVKPNGDILAYQESLTWLSVSCSFMAG